MPLNGIVQEVQVVGSHVLWQEWGDHVRIAHRAASGETELFLAVDNGDVKAFATDGVVMAWVQAFNPAPDGQYERVELWTSPYVLAPDELEPRKVADIGRNVTEAFIGGGRWGFLKSLDEIQINHWELELYRLSDGELRQFEFPLGWAVAAEISWLTAEELATPARGIYHENAFFRVAIDQLPAE